MARTSTTTTRARRPAATRPACCRDPSRPDLTLITPKDQPVAEITDEGKGWVADLDTKFVICRNRGHKWPDLDPTATKKPRGLNWRPHAHGVVEWRETCARCDTVRWRVTLPGGVIDRSAQWHYEYPQGGEYNAPAGQYVSRGYVSAEYDRRLTEGFLGQALREIGEAAMLIGEDEAAQTA